MFTVLIAQKEHIDAIQQGNKLFFEPFLENKELAFCYWNPEGQNLRDSVPGLLDAVGRKKEWRAVILNNCSMLSAKQRNPFDVVDSSGIDSLEVPVKQPELDADLTAWEESWKKYYEDLSQAKEAVYKEAQDISLS